MKPGDKVLCVRNLPKSMKPFIRPLPKRGWVYIVERPVLARDDKTGDFMVALQLVGITNPKGESQSQYFPDESFFKVIPDRWSTPAKTKRKK